MLRAQPKILLIGANGQVGRALLDASLADLGDITVLTRVELDMTRPDTVQSVLTAHKPNIIINAAAYTAVDQAEQDEQTADAVNHLSVREMARYAYENNILLVHYSTDYVFDGTQETPYLETDVPNPINVYGKTKWASDRAILDSGCDALIFRTTWVIGRWGKNFVKTILNLAATRDALCVIADQHGVPTTADWIAEMTIMALQNKIPAGIYNLVPNGATTWHGIACYAVDRAIRSGAKLALQGGSADIAPISATEYPLPAQRPMSSRLNTEKLQSVLKPPCPDWREGVNTVVDDWVQNQTKETGT